MPPAVLTLQDAAGRLTARMLVSVLLLIVAYFLGAVPFAVIIARRCGVDILRAGSGNPGATNVMRTCGALPGRICFALDALKGTTAVLLARYVGPAETAEWLPVAALLCALVGHSLSVFIKFKGGKGVATSMGGMLGLMPLVLIIGLVSWLVVFSIWRYVSLGSLVFGVVLPVAAWLNHESPLNIGLAVFIGLVLFIRHRDNIKRLLNGTENKFERKKK